MFDIDELHGASEKELKQEYRRLHSELTSDNSAVKNKMDLVLSDTMQFIKTLLMDLHGAPSGELVKLDNPEV